MKITKAALKRIIKEEVLSILMEIRRENAIVERAPTEKDPLGKYAWPKARDSLRLSWNSKYPEAAKEPNTDLENELGNALMPGHVSKNIPLRPDVAENFWKLIQSGLYDDILQAYTGPCWRGINVTREWVEKNLSIKLPQKPKFYNNPKALLTGWVEIPMTGQKLHPLTPGAGSSWTSEKEAATMFARHGVGMGGSSISLVFEAKGDLGNNRFIDLEPFYKEDFNLMLGYSGFDSEVIGIGAIEIVKCWWYWKTDTKARRANDADFEKAIAAKKERRQIAGASDK